MNSRRSASIVSAQVKYLSIMSLLTQSLQGFARLPCAILEAASEASRVLIGAHMASAGALRWLGVQGTWDLRGQADIAVDGVR
jgi:hypothetical protein